MTLRRYKFDNCQGSPKENIFLHTSIHCSHISIQFLNLNNDPLDVFTIFLIAIGGKKNSTPYSIDEVNQTKASQIKSCLNQLRLTT